MVINKTNIEQFNISINEVSKLGRCKFIDDYYDLSNHKKELLLHGALCVNNSSTYLLMVRLENGSIKFNQFHKKLKVIIKKSDFMPNSSCIS